MAGLTDRPFVLLDDARAHGASPARLYTAPLETVVARTPGEVAVALAHIKRERGHWAGFLSYEAGHALEPKLAPLVRDPGLPLL